MAAIGVIVPVYNVERYLRKCIESILNQTFQDFELILIDDGSTDKGGEICDDYATRSDKIKIIHQRNEGLSAARNRGMRENQSEYITFIDSDDYIDCRYLEKLWLAQSHNHADLVISENIVVEEIQKTKQENAIYGVGAEVTKVVSKEEAFRCMLEGKYSLLFAWGKLYHRRLFREVAYPEGELFEDVKVICKLVQKADTIVYTSYAGYFYVQRADSITHGAVSEKHMILLDNEKEFWMFIKKYYPNIEYLAKREYFRNCFYLIERTSSAPQFKEECKRLRTIIFKNWKYLIFSKDVSIMERGGTICLLLGISCYRTAWKLYKRIFQ